MRTLCTTTTTTEVIFKLYWTENSTVIEGDCEVSLRSLSQQPPGIYTSNAIGSSRELNPSCRVCHLRAVPQGHVANNQSTARPCTRCPRKNKPLFVKYFLCDYELKIIEILYIYTVIQVYTQQGLAYCLYFYIMSKKLVANYASIAKLEC